MRVLPGAQLARPRPCCTHYRIGVARQPLLARGKGAALRVIDKSCGQRPLRHVVPPDLVNAHDQVAQ